MISHLTSYYEEQFKNYIMLLIIGEQKKCLDTFVHELISENKDDTQTIHIAYMNVKKEIVG
ncbi:hypothetical protein UACE39S_02943 [Ureibacillus acetophenoni]